MGTIKNCKYKLEIEFAHAGGNRLRVEIMEPAARCSLKKKREDIDLFRWMGSGGSAMDVCHPCSGNCPLKVEGDVGGYGSSAVASCPSCGRIRRRKYGESPENTCPECGEVFQITVECWD